MTAVRIVTFNVCGMRGLLSRAAQWVPDGKLETMFAKLEADIVCFQETKLLLGEMPKHLAIVPDYTSVFTSAVGKRGYAGVAVYVKNTMRIYRAEEGLTGWLRPEPNMDPYRLDKSLSIDPEMYPEMSEQMGLQIDRTQMRALTLDLGVCVLIGLYCPADSQGNMNDFKTTFFDLLDWRVHKLQEHGREVIVLGDLNIAREPIDSAPLVEHLTKQKLPVDKESWLFANPARSAVNNWVLNEGFIDTTRQFHPTRARMFTCWDQQRNCRPANFGSRIDYILASRGLKCIGADIMPKLVGSDHCPVYAEFDFKDCWPQTGSPLPPLARRVVDKFPKTMDFFLKRKPVTNAVNEDSLESVKVRKIATIIENEMPNAGRSGNKQSSETENKVSQNEMQAKTYEPNENTLVPKLKTKLVADSAKQGSVTAMFGAKNPEWESINQNASPPLCQHGNPCILNRSKKPPRKGEWFWSCGLPMGGKINTELEHRCKTFIWAADRKNSK